MVHLLDLKLSSERVQDKIAHYLNDLLSIGVAGFRVDASKHMWPSDLEIIFAKMTNSNEAYFPPQTKPFIYCEVIDVGGEPIAAKEYTGLGTWIFVTSDLFLWGRIGIFCFHFRVIIRETIDRVK